LATQDFTIVTIDPGLREHGRGFKHEDLALDDAEGLQGRDPGFEVRARKRVTKLDFGGLPKGKVARRRGHEQVGGLRKVVHRLFGSPKVGNFCKRDVKVTKVSNLPLGCRGDDGRFLRFKSLFIRHLRS
jgi:hypothetical protein